MNCINLSHEQELQQIIDSVQKLEQCGVEISPFKYDFVFSHIPMGALEKIELDSPYDFSKIYAEKMDSTFYIHIPFCTRKCKYCYFIKKTIGETNITEIDEYLEALIKEFQILQRYFNHWDAIDSIYVGGGTPSILDNEKLKKLFDKIINPLKNLIGKENIEVAMELHPENMNKEKLNLLKDNKVTRISFGIQTFDEEILKAMGRSNEGYQDAIENCKTEDFENWNLDMIYGLPGQTIETIENDLKKILEYEPPSITWYQLWFAPRKKNRKILLKGTEQDIMERDDFVNAKLLINKTLKGRYTNISGDWYVRENKYYTNYEKYKIESKGNIGIGIGIYQYYGNYIFENASDWEEYFNYIYKGKLAIQWIRKMTPVEIFVRKTVMGLKGLTKPLKINRGDYEKFKTNAENTELKNFFDKINILINNEVFQEENNDIVLNEDYYLFRDYLAHFLIEENGWFIEKKGVLESLNSIDVHSAVEEFHETFGKNYEKYSIAFFVGLFEEETENFDLQFSHNYIYTKSNSYKSIDLSKQLGKPKQGEFSFLKTFYLPDKFLATPVCIYFTKNESYVPKLPNVPSINLAEIKTELEEFLEKIYLSSKYEENIDFEYVKKYYGEISYENLGLNNQDTLYIYHIPFFETRGIGGIELATTKCLNKEELLCIKRRLLGYFSARLSKELGKEEKYFLLKHALRSAVAAIMARNMSHNIGSHVLNYLSNPQELDNLWVI